MLVFQPKLFGTKEVSYIKQVTTDEAKPYVNSVHYDDIVVNKTEYMYIYGVNDYIYDDDTMEMIKVKYLKALHSITGIDALWGDSLKTLSLHELHAFGLKAQTLHIDNYFEKLTDYGEYDIKNKHVYNDIQNTLILKDKQDALHKYIAKDVETPFDYKDVKDIFKQVNAEQNSGGSGSDDTSKHEGAVYTIDKISLDTQVIGMSGKLIANPYDLFYYSTLLSDIKEQNVVTLNKQRLYNKTPLFGNVIYMVHAIDVLSNKVSIIQGGNIKQLIQLYFPLLLNEKIDTIEKIKEKQSKLYSKTKSTIASYEAEIKQLLNIHNTEQMEKQLSKLEIDDTQSIKKQIEGIQQYNPSLVISSMIQNIMKNEDKITQIQNYFKELSFTYTQKTEQFIPLDVMFNMFNCDENIQIIVMNPGKRKENTYKLYSIQDSQDGTPIPYSVRSTALFVGQHMKRTKNVTVYVDNIIRYDDEFKYIQKMDMELDDAKEGMDKVSAILGFNPDGSVDVALYNETNTNIDIVEEAFRRCYTSITKKYVEYLKSVGIQHELFSSLNSTYITFTNIEYNVKVNTGIVLDYDLISKYMNDVFVVDKKSKQKNKPTELTYIRVNNYKKMNKLQQYIVKRINNRDTVNITKDIAENFSMSEVEASIKYKNILSELSMIEQNNANNKRTLQIADDAGLNIVIQQTEKNEYDITIDNITSIYQTISLFKYLLFLFSVSEKPEKFMKNVKKYGTPIIAKPLKKSEIIQEKKLTVNALDMFKTDKLDNKDKTKEDDKAMDGVDMDGDYGDDVDEDLMDLLDMSEDDDDDEDDRDDGDDGDDDSTNADVLDFSGKKQKGSGKTNLKPEDIIGMSLSNPTTQMKKLEKNDPVLFLKKKEGRFNSYSRLCPSNLARQPFTLSDEEKKELDKEYSGKEKPYKHAWVYGSTKEKQQWYICPRYWCLLTNSPMTETDVSNGKCGNSSKIIPHKAKKVPKDAFVLESFGNDTQHKDSKGNYIHHVPGFTKAKTSHPDNFCVPCCFKQHKWNSLNMKNRRKQCGVWGKDKYKEFKTKKDITFNSDFKEAEDLEEIRENVRKENENYDKDEDEDDKGVDTIPTMLELKTMKIANEKKIANYKEDNIKDFNKSPLNEKDIGILRPSIINLLGVELKMDNEIGKVLKQETFENNTYRILRYGIQHNNTKSFLLAIGDVMTKNFGKLYTLDDVIKSIQDEITLDNYVTYNDGNLVKLFYNDTLSLTSKQREKHEDTELYKKLYANQNERKQMYFDYICKSHLNFIQYLKDPKEDVNYEYLWDILSKTNLVAEGGIDLMILEKSDIDETDNINVICPKHCNDNVERKLVILYKNENYYEPVYVLDKRRVMTDKNKMRLMAFVVSPFFTKDITFDSTYNNVSTIKEQIENVIDVYEMLSSNCNKNKKHILYNEPLQYQSIQTAFENEESKDKILYNVLNTEQKIVGMVIELFFNDDEERKIREIYNTYNKSYVKQSSYKGFIPTKYEYHLKDTSASSSSTKSVYVFSDEAQSLYNEPIDSAIFIELIGMRLQNDLKPMFKVYENMSNIGLLTNTNQFVPFNAPVKSQIDPLPMIEKLNENSFFTSQEYIHLGEDNKDMEEYRNKHLIEQHFYKLYMNKIRSLINGDYDKLEAKKDLQATLKDTTITTAEKTAKLNTYLKENTESLFEFTKMNVDDIQTIVLCLNEDKTKNECKKYITDSLHKKTYLPSNNIVYPEYNNKQLYRERLINDMIYNSFMYEYMFKPRSYNMFGNMQLRLKDTETLVLESQLTPELFKQKSRSRYIHNNVSGFVLPKQAEYYMNDKVDYASLKTNKTLKKTKKKKQSTHKTMKDKTPSPSSSSSSSSPKDDKTKEKAPSPSHSPSPSKSLSLSSPKDKTQKIDETNHTNVKIKSRSIDVLETNIGISKQCSVGPQYRRSAIKANRNSLFSTTKDPLQTHYTKYIENATNCVLDEIIHMDSIKNERKKPITKKQLLDILVNYYTKHMKATNISMIQKLRQMDFKTGFDDKKMKSVDVDITNKDEFIKSIHDASFFITPLDIDIIANELKLPIVLLFEYNEKTTTKEYELLKHYNSPIRVAEKSRNNENTAKSKRALENVWLTLRDYEYDNEAFYIVINNLNRKNLIRYSVIVEVTVNPIYKVGKEKLGKDDTKRDMYYSYSYFKNTKENWVKNYKQLSNRPTTLEMINSSE
jgi:hypothetical protein